MRMLFVLLPLPFARIFEKSAVKFAHQLRIAKYDTQIRYAPFLYAYAVLVE